MLRCQYLFVFYFLFKEHSADHFKRKKIFSDCYKKTVVAHMHTQVYRYAHTHSCL